jgi:predicted Zn-dependent protease with MMP-like domain
MSSTRDDIAHQVERLLERVAEASDNADLSEEAREDLRGLWAGIQVALERFNQPAGNDPFGDGGPSAADLAGKVQHDIG